MDVREFVSSTLVQVMQGVADSQEVAQRLQATVNPAIHRSTKQEQPQAIGATAGGQAIYMMDFDIAITVGNDTAADGGMKLEVASLLKVGGSAKATDRSESTSRVRFTVPITFPVDVASTEERDKRQKAAAEAFKLQRRATHSRGIGNWERDL